VSLDDGASVLELRIRESGRRADGRCLSRLGSESERSSTGGENIRHTTDRIFLGREEEVMDSQGDLARRIRETIPIVATIRVRE
jgi:hypothetical protein